MFWSEEFLRCCNSVRSGDVRVTLHLNDMKGREEALDFNDNSNRL